MIPWNQGLLCDCSFFGWVKSLPLLTPTSPVMVHRFNIHPLNQHLRHHRQQQTRPFHRTINWLFMIVNDGWNDGQFKANRVEKMSKPLLPFDTCPSNPPIDSFALMLSLTKAARVGLTVLVVVKCHLPNPLPFWNINALPN